MRRGEAPLDDDKAHRWAIGVGGVCLAGVFLLGLWALTIDRDASDIAPPVVQTRPQDPVVFGRLMPQRFPIRGRWEFEMPSRGYAITESLNAQRYPVERSALGEDQCGIDVYFSPHIEGPITFRNEDVSLVEGCGNDLAYTLNAPEGDDSTVEVARLIHQELNASEARRLLISGPIALRLAEAERLARDNGLMGGTELVPVAVEAGETNEAGEHQDGAVQLIPPKEAPNGCVLWFYASEVATEVIDPELTSGLFASQISCAGTPPPSDALRVHRNGIVYARVYAEWGTQTGPYLRALNIQNGTPIQPL